MKTMLEYPEAFIIAAKYFASLHQLIKGHVLYSVRMCLIIFFTKNFLGLLFK